MFKHILIPTDGSALAEKAVKEGVTFAKEVNAKVTGFCSIEKEFRDTYGRGHLLGSQLQAQLLRSLRELGRQYVAVIGDAAKAAGVEFNGVVSEDDTPDEGIIKTVKEFNCDAIFMASHGRRGIQGVILGSVTHRVLTHSTIPVVVFR